MQSEAILVFFCFFNSHLLLNLLVVVRDVRSVRFLVDLAHVCWNVTLPLWALFSRDT